MKKIIGITFVVIGINIAGAESVTPFPILIEIGYHLAGFAMFLIGIWMAGGFKKNISERRDAQ